MQGVRDRHGLGAIQNLGVAREHRRCGLGTSLLLRSLAGFRQAGVRRVYLEVTAQNDAAIRLYRRVGFTADQNRLQNRRGGILPVTQPIFSHTYPNGLVLVAEPIDALQSAAFTFLVPAGCVYDPADRGGLSSFTCEMALRGAGPRDSRQFILDLDNLGVERGESVSNAHTSYSGATLAENLPKALAIYADVLRRPHLPEDQLEAGRLAMLQELRAVEDEPAQKVMIELRRRHYPEPWGRPAQGEQEALEATTIDDIRGYFRRCYRPNGTILGVAGRIELGAAEGLGGRIAGRLAAGRRRRHRRDARRGRYQHLPYDSHQTQIGIAYASVPYRHPDYFQALGAVGVLSGGMSARLFTEVRERRGLCYSVYATLHTLLRSRRRVLLRRHRRRAGPGDAGRDPGRVDPAGQGHRRARSWTG